MNDTKKRRGFGEPETESQVLRFKRINFIALIGLIVMIGLTFYYILALGATKRKLEESEGKLKVTNDSLVAMKARQEKLISELRAFQDHMATENAAAIKTLDTITTLMQGKNYIKASAILKLQEDATKAPDIHHPYINLYFFQYPKEEMKKLRAYLNENNFPILKEETLTEMKKWLVDVSTVEYYDAEMRPAAERIAKELSNRTGTQFEPAPSYADDGNSHLHWINIVAVGAAAVNKIREVNAPAIQMQMEQKAK